MAVPLRTAYHFSNHSVSSLSSAFSDDSNPAGSTAPTTPLFLFKHGGRYNRSGRPGTDDDSDDDDSDGVSEASDSLYDEGYQADDADDSDAESVASVLTYASTVASQSQQQRQTPEEFSSIALPVRQNEHQRQASRYSNAMASSPSDFAYYFPSTRLLRISHPDDCDGNMNLTIQTDGWAAADNDPRGEEAPVAVPLTLYHLRMHNLKKREFSLRRYCRQSGREVCHSTRKYTRPAIGGGERQGFQRRISSVLASLRSGTLSRSRKSVASSSHSLKRTDSGYASLATPNRGTPGNEKSLQDVEAGFASHLAQETIAESEENTESSLSAAIPKAANLQLPLNTTKLQFSNYMHIDMKRRGGRGRGVKRYEFEHWGKAYSWHRRLVRRTDEQRFPDSVSVGVEFHLHAHGPHHLGNKSVEIAHIVPEILSAEEQAAETRAGGWVPRCSMWISDADIISRDDGAELADVIVSTGLLALVDDMIKRRWDRRERLFDRMTRSLPAR